MTTNPNAPLTPALATDTATAPTVIDTTLPITDAGLGDGHATGYEKAERHRGNPHALANLLNRALHGHLVDERRHEARQQEQRERTDRQLTDLEKQVETARTAIRRINDTDLPALQSQLHDYDEQVLQIRRDEAAGNRNPDHRDRLLMRFYGTLVVLMTVFVYLFYVSAFYSAFYRDLASELTAGGKAGMTAVLSAIFARMAFTELDFHWVGPILLFAFGGALHVLYGYQTRLAWVGLGLCMAVILGTDSLIAYFIEAKNHDIKVMMGLANASEHIWYAAPVFWMVLAMGFVGAMIWSLLLHAWMHELGKKDVARLAALAIGHLRDRQAEVRQQMNDLRNSMTELEGQIIALEIDMKALRSTYDVVTFSRSELEEYVTDFYDGWLTYVNNRMGSDPALRDACETVLRDFYAVHFTEPAANG